MLLLETKLVPIGETAVKLYSVNGGKLWVSRPADVRVFKLRQRHHEKLVKKWVGVWIPPDQ